MLDATEMSVSTDADFKTAPRGAQPRARGFECDSRDTLERRHDVAVYAERRRRLHRDFLNLLYWAGR
jgi:hypothetical protein